MQFSFDHTKLQNPKKNYLISVHQTTRRRSKTNPLNHTSSFCLHLPSLYTIIQPFNLLLILLLTSPNYHLYDHSISLTSGHNQQLTLPICKSPMTRNQTKPSNPHIQLPTHLPLPNNKPIVNPISNRNCKYSPLPSIHNRLPYNSNLPSTVLHTSNQYNHHSSTPNHSIKQPPPYTITSPSFESSPQIHSITIHSQALSLLL